LHQPESIAPIICDGHEPLLIADGDRQEPFSFGERYQVLEQFRILGIFSQRRFLNLVRSQQVAACFVGGSQITSHLTKTSWVLPFFFQACIELLTRARF
jgi:hypothetical protein